MSPRDTLDELADDRDVHVELTTRASSTTRTSLITLASSEGVHVIRPLGGANCSSVGSVVDALFLAGIGAGALMTAVTAALALERVVRVGNAAVDDEDEPDAHRPDRETAGREKHAGGSSEVAGSERMGNENDRREDDLLENDRRENERMAEGGADDVRGGSRAVED